MDNQNPSFGSRTVDAFKQAANKLLDFGNNIAVKYGNGTITPRFETIADRQANEYQKNVEYQNIIAHAGPVIRDDPRNNGYVYRGNIAPSKNRVAVNKIVPTPTTKRLVPTGVPSKYPLPTTTPYPLPTPIPGLGLQGQTPQSNTFLEKVIIPMAKRYNVHPAIAAGQFAREGRLYGEGARKNNFFNIGNTNAVAAEAFRTGDYSKFIAYASPELGTQRYFDFISGMAEDTLYANGPSQKKIFRENWEKNRKNPEKFLQTIGETYAPGGVYAKDVVDTPEYRKYNEEMQAMVTKLNGLLAKKKK